jgi:hypothetical protein
MKVNAIAQVTGMGIKLPAFMYQRFKQHDVGDTVRISISPASNRSNPQNRYYWGVVLPLLAEAYNEIEGTSHTVDDMHVYCKLRVTGLFSYRVESITGNAVLVPKSTADITKKEFVDMVDKIVAWAAQYLGVQIPSPDEAFNLTNEINITV